MTQNPLFPGGAPTFVSPTVPTTLAERFEQFDVANPWVGDALVKLADAWRARRPGQPLGMKLLFEVLRWEWHMSSHDPSSSFKLNNDLAAYYARQIMANYPRFDGMFHTRRLRA